MKRNKANPMVEDESSFQQVRDFPVQPWSIDLESNQFECPKQLLTLLGYPKQSQLTLSQLFATLEKPQLQLLKKHIKQVIQTGQALSQTVILNAFQHRYIADINIDSASANGKILKGSIELKQSFLTKQQELEFLNSLFAKSMESLMIADANHRIIKVNQAMCQETGYTEHELLGRPAAIFKSGRYTDSFYQKLWQHVDKHKVWSGELLARSKQAEVYTHEVTIQRIDLPKHEHVYVSSSHRLDSYADLWDADDPNQRTTIHVPDKNAFTKKLNADYQQLGKNQTIICMVFNVSLAQKLSNITLQWLVAQRFNQLQHPGHLGILSNKMFAAYWLAPKQVEDIEKVLKQSLHTLEGETKEQDIVLSASINAGVSVLHVDANSPIQLLSHATQSLIANSQGDSSSLHYFDRRLSKRFSRKSTLATLLRKALAANQVSVYYQPIVDIEQLKIVKFEALCRVKLDTEMSYGIQELIDIAEEYKWIDKIDAIVTQQALADLSLLQKHFDSPQLGMSLNRSVANDSVSHCCLEETLDILKQSCVDLSLITVELTESAYFDDSYYHAKWIDKLKAHQISIALDDFGTGYSSFSYLRQIPVNTVKIDRSFVSGLSEGSHEYAMIDMLCKLTHKMGGNVVAEGVESAQELNLLSKLKVDKLQGYLFDKPQALGQILQKDTLYYPHLKEHLHQGDQLYAKNIMRRHFAKLGLDDKLKRAAEKFAAKQYRFILVIEKSHCVGVLYQADLNAAISPYLNTEGEQQRDLLTLNKRVHQVMKKDQLEVAADTPLEKLFQQFVQYPYTVAVVTGPSGVCLGLITLEDMLRQQLNQQSDES